jgi:hypothetical protein
MNDNGAFYSISTSSRALPQASQMAFPRGTEKPLASEHITLTKFEWTVFSNRFSFNPSQGISSTNALHTPDCSDL